MVGKPMGFEEYKTEHGGFWAFYCFLRVFDNIVCGWAACFL